MPRHEKLQKQSSRNSMVKKAAKCHKGNNSNNFWKILMKNYTQYLFITLLTLLTLSLTTSFTSAFAEDSPSSPPSTTEESLTGTPPTHSLPAPEKSEFNFGEEFSKMILILALIIGLLLFSAWFLKRLMHQRVEQMNQSSEIKILERRIINQKTIIYIMEVSGKRIVVGESPAGLTTLADLGSETNPSTTSKSETPQSPGSFGDILQRKIKDRP
ncbi:Uncharacterized protein SCG7109_BB_00040 [Chlamydiales bacterium SCGC AG-110-M15]|nr:Uncharacterized protein SCG7109_BB_00040 [Chlamydiales bacterium SCGC AG-110-M15]